MHYELEAKRPLGRGTYGTVYRAQHKTNGCWHAIKKIKKTGCVDPSRVCDEIAIMQSLDHPNIVKLYEVFEDHEAIYLVLELCAGGELFDLIATRGRIPESEAAALMESCTET